MEEGAYLHMHHLLAACSEQGALCQAVVNAPFAYKIETTQLSLGIIVLLIANKADGMIHRVALSETELAAGTKDVSVKRFEDIKIPIGYERNVVATAISRQEPQRTADWTYLFAPDLSPEEARLNQAGGAIACSVVYPLPGVGDGAALIFSYYQYLDRIGDAQEVFMQRYSNLVAERLRTA